MSSPETTFAESPGEPVNGKVQEWVGRRAEYPRDRTVAQIFEAVVEAHGSRTAVICGSRQFSYRKLNDRANQLALRLRESGVREETLVGLCAERSAEMIIAILAILKAGGAYVPFDSKYPHERIQLMLEDTQTPLMIVQRSLASFLPQDRAMKTIFLEDELSEAVPEVISNLSPSGGPRSLAYVMYTSGSTGRPKGVLVEQRSIARLVFNTNYCVFGPEQVFLQFAPISFDASTLEIWGALLHGATLVIMPGKASSLEQLGEAIRQHGVTTLWLAAGLFHLFVDERLEDLRPLRQLLAGGDVLSAHHIRKALAAHPHLTIINGYGPTEGTTFTCCHPMLQGDVIPDSVPIGRPISNSFAYILDDELALGGPENTGELFAGGDGIARGYLNSPELTSDKFLNDPFSQEA